MGKMTKLGQRMVAILLSALLLISALPVTAFAVREDGRDDSVKTIEGLVFWGTSNVSRMYGDIYSAVFGESASERSGQFDVMQHEWASYHSTQTSISANPHGSMGGGYEYLNLGKFSNYTVADAPDYAVLRNDHKDWDPYNTEDLRVSSGQTSYYGSSYVGDGTNPTWREGAVRSLREAIEAGVRGQRDGGSQTHKSDPQGWDIDKTAVVIWAGEDWVVRNQDSSDIGLPSGVGNAKHLQWYWMGLGIEPVGEEYHYYDHYFDPCPGVNGLDSHGDVLHQHVDGGMAEVERVVPLAPIEGAHYGSEGVGVTECDHENVTNCARLNDVDAVYNKTGKIKSGGGKHHTLVFYNSYMVRDFLLTDWQEDGDPGDKDEPHMDAEGSGFAYNSEQDGITVIPDHVMSEISDKFPGYSSSDPVKLPSQVGLCFGRVLSGYGYSVEYLQQNVTRDNEGNYSGASTSVMTDEQGNIVYQTEKDPVTGETLYEDEVNPFTGEPVPIYVTDPETGDPIPEEGASVDKVTTEKVWVCKYHPAVYEPVDASSWMLSSDERDAHYGPDWGDSETHNHDTGVPYQRYVYNGRYWSESAGDYLGDYLVKDDRIPGYDGAAGYDDEPIELIATTDHANGPSTWAFVHIRDVYVGSATDQIPDDVSWEYCSFGSRRSLYEDINSSGYPTDYHGTLNDSGATKLFWIYRGYVSGVSNLRIETYVRTDGYYASVRSSTSHAHKVSVPKEKGIKGFYWSGTVIKTVDVDIYQREFAYEKYTPAWYEWYQIEVPLHTRCDWDLAADTGYADSWHTHQYGGIGGFVNGFPVDPEKDDDGVVDGRLHVIPTEAEDKRGGYGSGAGGRFVSYMSEHPVFGEQNWGVWVETTQGAEEGAALDPSTFERVYVLPYDHAEDYTEIQTWFTNPDKPIMKVISEARTVRGYIDYLKDWFSKDRGSDHWTEEYSTKKGSLKFYVFGLPAYNKALYDDQKDEIWTDTEDENNTDVAYMTDRPAAHYQPGGAIDEIERTNRVEEARKTYGKMLNTYARGATYIDIYDETAVSRPYYRYQNLFSSDYMDETHEINAQHGKWYDQNTNIWVFNLMWNTILKDNPRDPWGDPISVSFYAASSALATYANGIVSVRGRSLPEDAEEGSVPEDAHTLSELTGNGNTGKKTNAGIAGVAMGYGDESYQFREGYTSTDTATTSAIAYNGLVGLEVRGTTGANQLKPDSGMYLYAQYGKLLADLGIDEVNEENPVSPRILPGLLLSGTYAGNSALNVLWSSTIDLLRMLNPFGILSQCSQIANSAAALEFNPSSINPQANQWLVNAASHNEGLRQILAAVGDLYDVLSGRKTKTTTVDMVDPFTGVHQTQQVDFMIVIMYVVFFIAGVLLFFNRYKQNHMFWSKTKVLLIRVVFICIGVPLIANMYTAILDGLSAELSVVGSPASQMVSGTIVDFGGWVRTSRLAPPQGTIFKAEVADTLDNSQPSGDSISNLRKTAWAINEETGILKDVRMTVFANEDLEDPNKWSAKGYIEYDPTKPALVDGWNKNANTLSQVWAAMRTWMNASYYYSTVFESDTMARFASEHPDKVGYIPESGETSEEALSDSANTLFELFNESTLEKWENRTLDESKQILSGDRWEEFSIYTNGGLQTAVDGTMSTTGGSAVITYTGGTEGSVFEDAGEDTDYRRGLDLTKNTGGLSTLAMYNYLSSEFRDSNIIVYSSARTPSGYTGKAHYRVNVIGSGITEILFFVNCFLFMFAAVIIGFAYSLMMVISVLKRGFAALAAIPGAMLGVMKSIAQVLVSVCAMILEIFVSIGLYGAVSELLLTLNTLLEGPLSASLENLTAYGLISQPLAISAGSYILHLAVMCVFFGAFSIAAYLAAPAFLRVWDKVVSLVFISILGRVPEPRAKRAKAARDLVPQSMSVKPVPVGATIYKLFV